MNSGRTIPPRLNKPLLRLPGRRRGGGDSCESALRATVHYLCAGNVAGSRKRKPYPARRLERSLAPGPSRVFPELCWRRGPAECTGDWVRRAVAVPWALPGACAWPHSILSRMLRSPGKGGCREVGHPRSPGRGYRQGNGAPQPPISRRLDGRAMYFQGFQRTMTQNPDSAPVPAQKIYSLNTSQHLRARRANGRQLASHESIGRS